MTKTQENAADITQAALAATQAAALADIATAKAIEQGMVPAEEMDYEEWLEWTGFDDSFVGNGEGIPGTADLYDAVTRIMTAGESDVTPPSAP